MFCASSILSAIRNSSSANSHIHNTSKPAPRTVRRTKNRGAELRSSGDVRGALDHFKWALAINPRCATCLKDLSEAHGALADSAKAPRDRAAHLADAEAALRGALDLLPSDSDALFSLGVLLSKKGDADGALKAYEASADVNADDVELLYNLAVKLGEALATNTTLELYVSLVSLTVRVMCFLTTSVSG